MSTLSFNKVAAILFALVAAAHLARIVLALPVQIGTIAIPLWISWLGLVVAGSLSAWGFRSTR
jgi:hypothetical protein